MQSNLHSMKYYMRKRRGGGNKNVCLQRWDALLPWLLPPWLQAMCVRWCGDEQCGSPGGRPDELWWSPDVCNIITVQDGVTVTVVKTKTHIKRTKTRDKRQRGVMSEAAACCTCCWDTVVLSVCMCWYTPLCGFTWLASGISKNRQLTRSHARWRSWVWWVT